MSKGVNIPTGLASYPHERVMLSTHPEMPETPILVCSGCKGLVQAPNPGCKGPHGEVPIRTVMRHLCAVVGHVVAAHGKPALRCLHCFAPRSAVVS